MNLRDDIWGHFESEKFPAPKHCLAESIHTNTQMFRLRVIITYRPLGKAQRYLHFFFFDRVLGDQCLRRTRHTFSFRRLGADI